MKFYHYTSSERYHAILSGGHYGKTGLVPISRFLPLGLHSRVGLPEKAAKGAISGLLKPLDPSWCKREIHEGQPLLQSVISNIPTGCQHEIYLLEARVLSTDDAYVADFSPNLRPRVPERGEDYFDSLKATKQAYWNSLLPMKEYLSSGLPYLMPEVICFSPIPVERISVVDVFDVHTLKNLIRQKGGFSPLPAPPVRKDSFLDVFLEEERPDRTRKEKINRHLHLV